MPRRVLSPVLALVLLSGCCGGYSVVRTTVAEHAALGDKGELARADASNVLHYSRLGEPPNSCGSEVKYLEDLWIQVPSLAPGQAFTIGTPGVAASYSRQMGEEVLRAATVAGQIEIKSLEADGLTVALDVTITLPSGETVKLDDDYAFHPMTGGSGSATARRTEWISCRARL